MDVRHIIISYDTHCCHCKRPLRVPVKYGYDNPAFVMEIERRQVKMRDEILSLQKQMLQLAKECVEAGVKPTILREADEMRDKFKELLRQIE